MLKNEYFRYKNFAIYLDGEILMVRDENANKTYRSVSPDCAQGLSAYFLVGEYLDGTTSIDVIQKNDDFCLSFVHNSSLSRFEFNFNEVEDVKIPENEVEPYINDGINHFDILHASFQSMSNIVRENLLETEKLRNSVLDHENKIKELKKTTKSAIQNTRIIYLLISIYIGWLVYYLR